MYSTVQLVQCTGSLVIRDFAKAIWIYIEVARFALQRSQGGYRSCKICTSKVTGSLLNQRELLNLHGRGHIDLKRMERRRSRGHIDLKRMERRRSRGQIDFKRMKGGLICYIDIET
jgi:hypothetical protein